MKKVLAIVAVAGVASAASAQGLTMTNQTVAQGASGSFVVDFNFDAAQHFAFAAWGGSITLANGFTVDNITAAQSDPAFLEYTLAGASATDMLTGQLHFPPPIVANNANPFGAFEVHFTAPMADGVYDVTTTTTVAKVYVDATTATSAEITAGFGELAGTITVVPAPSSLALIGLGGLVATRRRR